MRYKIKNNLKKADYERMEEFLKTGASIELLPSTDLEFISVNPLVITVESFGYKIDAEILFGQPIGFEVYDDLELGDETRSVLSVNRRNFKLSKIVSEPSDLEKDVDMILKTVERIVNHICNRFGRLVEQTFTLSSEVLDRQFDMIRKREELKKRGEIPRPFAAIHARNSGDAKERAGDLVPIYMGRDKAYLYEDKKVFMLLPRDFVMKLLKIEGPAMIAADQFTDEEREALDKFSLRQYIRKTRIGGKTHYYNLDETTCKLLLRGMKKE